MRVAAMDFTRVLRKAAATVSLLVLGTTAWSQTNGYHDVGDCSTIAGWAWDASQPTTPISVDIYSDGALIATVPASAFRQDLQNAGIGDGNHSFQISTPAAVIDGQPHTLTVKYGGTQQNLNTTPKTVSCIAPGQPTPSYEGYLDVADCTHIALWAWDRNQPNSPITVDVYDGATLIATVSANAFRQDLLNAGKGNGLHSADIPLPAGLINGQGHTITARFGGTQTPLNTSPKTLSCIGVGQPTPSYEGYLDVADCTRIAGWGWDQNQANSPISIDLYDGNTLIATVSAGAFRQDLLNAGKGNGAHSFDIPLPAGLINGQGHTVTAMFSGTQTPLGTSPKTLSCIGVGQPTPNYEGYHDTAECTNIQGWAWDQNQPNAPVSIDVYDGATKIATVLANAFRQDLLDAGKGNGVHSFTLATPNSVKDGTAHTLTLKYGGTQQNLNTTPKSLTCAPVGTRLYYLFPDHLGTPRLVTDEQSNVVWRNLPTTEPFGNGTVEEDPNSTGNPFTFNLRFPGQYFDRESNLAYNTFRDYDPARGRYVQSDPIGLQGGINTYSYVGGKPVSFIDSLGLAKNAPWPRPVSADGNELSPHFDWGPPASKSKAPPMSCPRSTASMPYKTGDVLISGIAMGTASGATVGAVFGALAGYAEAGHLGAIGGLAVADGVYSGAMLGAAAGGAVFSVGAAVVVGGLYLYYR